MVGLGLPWYNHTERIMLDVSPSLGSLAVIIKIIKTKLRVASPRYHHWNLCLIYNDSEGA